MKSFMTPTGIIGMLLLIVSVIVLITGGSFTQKHDVLKIGDVKVTASEQKTIPPWAAALGAVAGVVLIASSTRRRT